MNTEGNTQGRVIHVTPTCVNPKLCVVCGGALKRGATKYCGSVCYRTIQRSGDPVARFWSKVDRSDVDGCWPWTASRTGGRTGGKYGQFNLIDDGRQRQVYAHVYAYELSNGPVPEGLEVMHLCHLAHCVRPSHLEAGTHTRNIQDSAQAGHYHVARPKGQRITDAELAEMLALHRDGMLQAHIAQRFGVSRTFICLLVKGKRRQYSEPVASELAPKLRKAG